MLGIPRASFSAMASSSPAALDQLLERSLQGRPAAAGTSSTERLLRDAARLVREHFGMDLVFLADLREGGCVLRYVDAGPHAQAFAAGRGEGLEAHYCRGLAEGRLPCVLPDANAHAEACRLAGAARLPLGAHLGLPIRMDDGALYGVFCCLRAQPDPTLNARDLATLRLFADLVRRVLQHQRAQGLPREARDACVRRMLQERRFHIVYQPVIDLARNAVVFYEALARFEGPPQQGPDRWFTQAAAEGLQPALERAVIQRALQDVPRLPPGVYLSLNVSPQTVLEPDFAAVLAGAPLERLALEITEHDEIADYAALSRTLAPLRAAGLRLTVDDAGAGFASFRHILQLAPDVIKLDASLIRQIDSRRQSRALAAALVRFAQETGCRIVAEGVETQAELDVLRALEVDKVQGYLLGRPGPLPAAAARSPA
jgi:EAL domain-containing protein (putative c-di-GMP-specific phosphodiesterase class I)